MLARMHAFAGKIKSQTSYEIKRFFQLWKKAGVYAEQRMWWDYYCRLISPDSIEVFKDYLDFTDFKVECIVVGLPADGIEGWPPETAQEFMDELMKTALKGCTIQISETLVPVANSDAHNLLRVASYANQSSQKNAMEANELHLPDEELRLDMRDINAGIQQLHDNQEKMLNGSYIITIWAEDDAAMKIAKSHVKGVLNAYRVSGKYPHYRELDAFLAAQPYPTMLDMATFPVFSSFAALVSPTVNPDTQIGTSEDGVYLGDDRHTGREITIKFSDLPAPHICMVGATGSGKTYALLLLLMRLYVEAKRKVIYLTKKPDPKTKYRAVAEYFSPDGCIVDIGPGKYNINPLQIIFDDTILSATPVEVAAKYDSQKDLFCAFLKEWFQDTYSPNMDSYVDETLDRVYGQKKIDREDAKMWINASWPTLEDLRNQWISEEVNLRGKKKSTCQALIDKTAKIRHGGALDYVNNPTNVDFSLGFMIIDLSGVPESIRDAMNVMVSGMLANQVTANAEKGLTIAIDEGGAFLREPRLASMILTGLTQWRAQDCQLIFATQQFSDLKKADLAEEFLTNCHTKIVLGAEMDQSAVPYVQKILYLSDSAVNDLVTSKKGEGIIKISNEHAAISFISTEEEHRIIKGFYTADPAEEITDKQAHVPVKSFEIRELYEDLVREHQVIFEYWLNPDYSAKALEDAGYKFFQLQRALDNGTINCWIHSSIINEQHVKNQTKDHYGTVMQIAAYLREKGFQNVQVHHEEDADITAKLNGISYAFEYERGRTHSISQIIDKNSRAKLLYDVVFFVCLQSNERTVKKAVGALNCRPRGFKLKDLIDSVAEGKYITEYQPTELKKSIISEIEAI